MSVSHKKELPTTTDQLVTNVQLYYCTQHSLLILLRGIRSNWIMSESLYPHLCTLSHTTLKTNEVNLLLYHVFHSYLQQASGLGLLHFVTIHFNFFSFLSYLLHLLQKQSLLQLMIYYKICTNFVHHNNHHFFLIKNYVVQ